MYTGRNTVILLMVKGKPKEDPDENERAPLAFDSGADEGLDWSASSLCLLRFEAFYSETQACYLDCQVGFINK